MYVTLQGLILDHRQLDGEGGTLAVLAVHLDLAVVEIDNPLDISQSEAEALHVVDITGMYAVELLEDLLKVLFLHTDARIVHG